MTTMAMIVTVAMVSNMNFMRNIRHVTEKNHVTAQQKGPANRPFLATLLDLQSCDGGRGGTGRPPVTWSKANWSRVFF